MTAPERVVVRPRRLARVAWATAGLVAGLFTVIAVALLRAPRGDASFRLADSVAMVLLGLLLAGAILLLTRARVEADADGVRVRNVLGETVLPWAVVAAVRMNESSPWASLDLHDDDTVALFAVQANDGERAVEAVQALRRLLQASRPTSGEPPP
jgi:hypothetical protein